MKKLIQFELRKIFAKRLTRVAIVAMLALSVLFGFSTYQNMYATDGISQEGSGRRAVEIDKSIAESYAGTLTDAKVQQMMKDFKPKQDLHGMNAAYLYRNATQSALFRKFSDLDGNWNGLGVADVFGNEEIKIGYTYGWFLTSRNMVRVFIALSLVVAVMIAPVFSGEYGGLDNIILTSKYGKTKCATAKILASILAALIVTTIVSAFNFIYAYVLYGGSGLDCSILFAPGEFIEGYIPFNITFKVLFIYQILLAFTSAICVTGITLIISAICKSPMVTLVISATIYLFPALLSVSETNPLFRIIALMPVYQVQFVSLMSIDQISGSILYALLAAPVALVLMAVGVVVPRKIFAKHQVT